MRLTQQTIVKKSDSRYKCIERLLHLSKNLYNAALYAVRQHYFSTGKYLNYYGTYQLLKDTEDYKSLPSQSAQQVLKQVDKSFTSFFRLLKTKRNCSIPKYKDKDGLNQIVYTDQQIRKRKLKDGMLSVPGLDCEFKTDLTEIKQIRFVPGLDYITLELVYNVAEPELLEEGNTAAIDLGIDNLMTVTFSDGSRPVIVNGRPLKSMNQYYNMTRSRLQSVGATKKIKKLTSKRNRKVKDYMHKATRSIVNHVVSNRCGTLVVGYNRQWKQDTDLGVVNNQNFVSIPHYKMLQMLEYKCRLSGIKLVTVDESYTSKASAMDLDMIPSLGDRNIHFSGRRTSRGNYKTKSGFTVNADVNGSLNIMRKVSGDEIAVLSPASRGFVSNPVRVNLD